MKRPLALDATYKLNLAGFPVLMAGTVDADKKYHPLGLALSLTECGGDFAFLCRSLKDAVMASTGHAYSPSFLLADAAQAITNGAAEVFGAESFVRLMCWFHASKKMQSKTRRLPSPMGERLYARLCVLQRSRSWEELQAGWALLKTEYQQLPADHLVHATLEYLEAEWLSPERRHWFEGAGPNRPSTNNALESMNGHLKSGHTLRARLPVLEFLGGVMERLVPAWSRDRAPACPTPKRFAELPTLSLPKWKEAYAFAHEGRTIKARREGAVRLFFVKAKTGELELTEESLGEWEERAAERSWATWADYVHDRSAFWTVRLQDQHWRGAVCDCPVFQKDRLCKHSLGLPIRLRLPGVDVPAAAKTLPLDGRRRPGRPALARRALIIQP